MNDDAPRKVVSVVTGAGRGLGRTVALALAARGDHVALLARSEAQLKGVEHEIKAAGGFAQAFPLDVSDARAVARVAQALTRDLGTVSVLVNAAGVFGPLALVRDSDPAAWTATIAANVIGPYLTCRAFLSGMLAQRWGRIVNFSSAAAIHTPGPLNSAYGTSKAALNQFTRHLAAEIAGSGVTANAIHPGDAKTEMWADIQEKTSTLGPEGDGFRSWVKWVEETGGDDPKKAADLVLRLTSPEAGDVNGQFVWIEGGLQTPVKAW
jgi:NAD(P)-dependent dehydrogenase (short-subunit alcohol dehydrogenase family)